MNIDEMASAAYNNARAHGFHDVDRTVGDEAALLMTEVAEFFEAFRSGTLDVTYREVDGKPEGLMSELADIVIRVGDTAERLFRAGLVSQTLQQAIQEKMAFNKTRPMMHGGKKL
jgi:NTP pyrophosphatase (non-canonical NTP hydrolase)